MYHLNSEITNSIGFYKSCRTRVRIVPVTHYGVVVKCEPKKYGLHLHSPKRTTPILRSFRYIYIYIYIYIYYDSYASKSCTINTACGTSPNSINVLSLSTSISLNDCRGKLVDKPILVMRPCCCCWVDAFT